MTAEKHRDVRVLKWGMETLSVGFPAAYEVEWVFPCEPVVTRSEKDIIKHALDHPIGSPAVEAVVKPGDNLVIIVNDRTRLWQKPEFLLNQVLERLDRTGVKNFDISIVVATGMHKAHSRKQLQAIVGPVNYGRFPIVDHDCRDQKNLVDLGHTLAGEPILINRAIAEADRVIAIGGISPHGVAGFSGGCKSVLPGVAGYDTIQQFHRLAFDDNFYLHRSVKPGQLDGNPVIPMMHAATRAAGVDFILNIMVGSNGRYLDAVAGDVVEAHRAGCRRAKDYFLIPCPRKASLVVASVGGYPRDIEMYQSIKALGHGAAVAAEGGTIILLSQCSEGIGADDWLSWIQLGDRKAIVRRLSDEFSFDGFVAFKALTITSTYRVILVSSLPAEIANRLGMEPAATLDVALNLASRDLPPDANVIAMPMAGLTVPYVKSDSLVKPS